MKYIFNFPDIGEGLDEGTIVEWLVKKGQPVSVGDNLVTMETDKVVAEIPSPKTGVISALYGKVGEIIKVGDALVEIEIEGVEGEKAQEEVAKGSDLEAVEEEGAGVVGTLEVAGNSAIMSSSSEGLDTEKTENLSTVKKALATPVARAMAKDLGVDINKIKGSGPAGRVMKEDIRQYVENNTQKSGTQIHTPEARPMIEVEKLSQIRKTIAKNMVNSKRNAAHMTLFDDVEISELDRIRKKYKESLAAKGIKLTYLAFILKATANALKKHKILNAEMDLDKDQMIYKNFINIGIAVDTDRGLVVPVIRNADQLSISDLAREIQLISEKARNNQLTLDDFKDGTFTITSYGSIGGKYAVPVINYPQAGILGIGKISKEAVVRNDELAVGLVLPLSISVDHRMVDGGDVARFMNTMLEYLSDPVSLIID